MREIWNDIEGWLACHAPEVKEDLLAGATGEAVRQAEEALGVDLPADVREAFVVHDGQDERSAGFLAGWRGMPLWYVVQTWRMLKDLLDTGEFGDADSVVETTGPLLPQWWNPGWIPVLDNGAGDFHCVDLSPAEGGRVGQIVTFWHVDVRREVVAGSFTELMADFARDLKAGKYRYEDEDWRVVGAAVPGE
jgi:cell wall assembly regulator SMI1